MGAAPSLLSSSEPPSQGPSSEKSLFAAASVWAEVEMRSDLCVTQAVGAEEQGTIFCLKLSEAAIEGGVIHSQRTPNGREVPEYGNSAAF